MTSLSNSFALESIQREQSKKSPKINNYDQNFLFVSFFSGLIALFDHRHQTFHSRNVSSNILVNLLVSHIFKDKGKLLRILSKSQEVI